MDPITEWFLVTTVSAALAYAIGSRTGWIGWFGLPLLSPCVLPLTAAIWRSPEDCDECLHGLAVAYFAAAAIFGIWLGVLVSVAVYFRRD